MPELNALSIAELNGMDIDELNGLLLDIPNPTTIRPALSSLIAASISPLDRRLPLFFV